MSSMSERMTPEERREFIAEVAEVLRASTPQLSADELQWVRLAIEAEARKIRFRDAIIEKSLASLVWAAICGAGFIVFDFMKTHGIRV